MAMARTRRAVMRTVLVLAFVAFVGGAVTIATAAGAGNVGATAVDAKMPAMFVTTTFVAPSEHINFGLGAGLNWATVSRRRAFGVGIAVVRLDSRAFPPGSFRHRLPAETDVAATFTYSFPVRCCR